MSHLTGGEMQEHGLGTGGGVLRDGGSGGKLHIGRMSSHGQNARYGCHEQISFPCSTNMWPLSVVIASALETTKGNTAHELPLQKQEDDHGGNDREDRSRHQQIGILLCIGIR